MELSIRTPDTTLSQKKSQKNIFHDKFFYANCNCELSCEDGMHRVDLQTPKKLKIFKTFQNSLIHFFQPHNGILSHLNFFCMYYDPIFMKIVGNKTFSFFHFLVLFGPLTHYTFNISEGTIVPYV